MPGTCLTKAHIIARYFVERILCQFGAPSYLKSDMGSKMIQKVADEAALLLGTKRLRNKKIVPPAPEDLDQILDNESINNELGHLLLEDRLIEEPKNLTGIKEGFEPDTEEEQTESNMFNRKSRTQIMLNTSKGNEELATTLRRSKCKVS